MSCNLDPNMSARALAEHRADMKAHVRRRNVPPELLRRLGSVYEGLGERGSMHGRVAAFGQAQEHFSSAAARLEEVRSRLDEHTYRDELARLRNARAVVYMDLGEYEKAADDALAAARTQEALGGEEPSRF